MAHAGWDSLVVDMQHGMIDYQMMITMLQAISTTNTVPLVRVPWNDPAHIQKALDAGAYGIICPMINNRAEAEKFVGSCRYAPLGYRSSGPIRAALYGGADYHMKANDIVARLRHDRDRRGDGKPRRDHVGQGARRDLYRPLGPVDLATAIRRAATSPTSG